jgi:hypothetical protein
VDGKSFDQAHDEVVAAMVREMGGGGNGR